MERILVADDDRMNRFMVERALKTEFEIHLANDGYEALEILQNLHTFRAVISDLEMPKMNGVALLENVKALEPETRRVLMSSRISDTNFDQAVLIPAEPHVVLAKPLSLDSIRESVRMANDMTFGTK